MIAPCPRNFGSRGKAKQTAETIWQVKCATFMVNNGTCRIGFLTVAKADVVFSFFQQKIEEGRDDVGFGEVLPLGMPIKG